MKRRGGRSRGQDPDEEAERGSWERLVDAEEELSDGDTVDGWGVEYVKDIHGKRARCWSREGSVWRYWSERLR